MNAVSVTCGVMVLGVVAIIVVSFGLYFNSLNEINKRLQQAFARYKQSLEVLKQQPNNPELRQRALEWGRYYSGLTRDNKRVTVYDEVALANDINAACAGAGSIENANAATPTRSIEERLEQLKALLSKGAISEQEYSERRSKILDEA
jgi:hypothetical protein